MALKSMTGFGAGSARAKGVSLSVELSSVNRKQLDAVLRLPPPLAAFESRAQKIIQQHMSRGRVNGTVQMQGASGEADVTVDQKRADAVIEKMRAVAEKLKLEDDLSASILLDIPGLLTVQSLETAPEEYSQCLEKALTAALKKLTAMRAKEGRELAADLKTRLDVLDRVLAKIKTLAPAVLSKRRNKLFQGLESSGMEGPATDERVLKEIALFAEKCDIAEEVTRLASHIKQFRARLRATEPVGRELDFLVQELLREINTVASKANDLTITKQAVKFKTELERIREQVQNVE